MALRRARKWARATMKEKQQAKQSTKTSVKKEKKETPSPIIKVSNKAKNLTDDDKSKLTELLKRIHINKVKWYHDKARTLIVEWLAIDKHNKNLNLHLADIYEIEKEYQKSEYIYRDILAKYEWDLDVLTGLAESLAKQEKNKEAINVYLKIHNKKKGDTDILEQLADLTFDIREYSESLMYTKLFLKQVPRNAEKIAMAWFCLERAGDIEKAIHEYEKVIQIQPYNNEIQGRILKLQTKLWQS